MSEGTEIIREGTYGNDFYIIEEGEVRCSQQASPHADICRRLTASDFFGERALLSTVPSINPSATGKKNWTARFACSSVRSSGSVGGSASPPNDSKVSVSLSKESSSSISLPDAGRSGVEN